MARVRLRALACCAAAVLALGGCGVPPELRGADDPPRPGRSSAPAGPSSAPAFPDPALPPPGMTRYPFPPAAPPATTRSSPSPTATRCTGGPTAAQLLDAVRKAPGVPAGAILRVTDGPYCAGGWQYAKVGIQADPAPEPLLVITRGRPRSLTLVEIGTDVCSEQVNLAAPAAIRKLACG